MLDYCNPKPNLTLFVYIGGAKLQAEVSAYTQIGPLLDVAISLERKIGKALEKTMTELGGDYEFDVCEVYYQIDNSRVLVFCELEDELGRIQSC